MAEFKLKHPSFYSRFGVNFNETIKKNYTIRIKRNIGITLVSGITALSMAGVAMQMGYANFKIKGKTTSHLNCVRFSTIIKLEWKKVGLQRQRIIIQKQSHPVILMTIMH